MGSGNIKIDKELTVTNKINMDEHQHLNLNHDLVLNQSSNVIYLEKESEINFANFNLRKQSNKNHLSRQLHHF